MTLPYTNHFEVRKNAAYRKLWGRIPYVRAASLFNFYSYSDMRKMVHLMKYGKRKDIAYRLGLMIGQKAKECGDFSTVDLIIPVPIHPLKLEMRGYNQTEIIAEGIAQYLQKPVRTDIIVKHIFTPSQTKKGRYERVKNVLKSFKNIANNEIIGKHVLIVDDVLTTGATIEAVGTKLLESKGVKISYLTACIAKR